jgi:hypothetical protein
MFASARKSGAKANFVKIREILQIERKKVEAHPRGLPPMPPVRQPEMCDCPQKLPSP